MRTLYQNSMENWKNWANWSCCLKRTEFAKRRKFWCWKIYRLKATQRVLQQTDSILMKLKPFWNEPPHFMQFAQYCKRSNQTFSPISNVVSSTFCFKFIFRSNNKQNSLAILGHISRGTDGFNTIYYSHFDIVIEIISEWPESVDYVNKLRRIRDEVMERGYKVYDTNPNHFNTLVHDDLWSTNLLIKKGDRSDDKPFENIMLIDFQFAFWASPAIDLHYFLNSSCCDSLRPHQFDALVKFYHDQLIDFLKRLNYAKHIPTWPEFHAQYRERMFLGKYSLWFKLNFNWNSVLCLKLAFIVSCLVQPLHRDNTENVDFQCLNSDTEEGLKGRRSLYKSEKIRETLKLLIPYYDQLGVFEWKKLINSCQLTEMWKEIYTMKLWLEQKLTLNAFPQQSEDWNLSEILSKQ